MTTTQREIDAISALGADALRTLGDVSRRAARLLARGEVDPRLHGLAAIVAAQGPVCPQCRCSIIGTSPTNCPGCGALVAWLIEARLI